MVATPIDRLFALARSGRLTRRQALDAGFKLGLATPLIAALASIPPEASASSKQIPSISQTRFRALQDDPATTFTAIITSGTEDIDPHYSYATLSSTVALAVYEMLVQYKDDSTSEIAPMLAESWEASEDNSTFTFKLYPDVVFQDGTVCDAQAVKDSYTRWLDLAGATVLVISRFVDSADMMEVVDPVTLRFNLGKPQPLFLSAMASQYGPSVISPKAITDNATDEDPYAHEWLKANAVGSGPYRLISNSLTDGIIMERFEEFHRGWEGNHFNKLILRVVPENATRRQLIEQGQADATSYNLTVEDVEALKQNADLNVQVYPSTQTTWSILNAKRLNLAARQGLSYAFPYDDVVNVVFKGMLARSGPIANNIRGSDPEVFLYQTDLEKAKALLLEGGIVEGDRLEYIFDGGDARETVVSQLLQANLQQMGFDLDISAVDNATLENMIYGDQPAEEKPHIMGGWGWWPDYNDPWNQLAPNFTAANIGNGGSNGGAWENARFEEIMAQAEVYTVEADLDKLMKEAQNILTEQDPPAIFYGQTQWFTILRKDVAGFIPNALYLSAYNFYGMSRATS